MSDADTAIEAIAANPAPASFDNTVAALETADEVLNKVCAVFYTLTGVDSNDKREALSRDFRAPAGRAWQQGGHGQAAV